MSIWYAILNALGLPMFEMDFMKNALLAVLLMGVWGSGFSEASFIYFNF